MTRPPPKSLDQNTIIDQLYDIALDPETLDSFISAWNGAGLDAQVARNTVETIDQFDNAFYSHIKRAETILHRGEDEGPTFGELLAPFENLAALIVDQSMQVVACNPGATLSFGVNEGDNLSALRALPDLESTFRQTLQDLFVAQSGPDRLIQVQISDNAPPTLFQMRRLSQTTQSARPLALVVTTQYHWHSALGRTLEEVFGITHAERGVVQALVEGRDAKSIAAGRGTSEGTVRSQIRSILGKMNARSQSEVIRLVLSLRDISSVSPESQLPSHPTQPTQVKDWLDAEIWKPFQTIKLPDGRLLDYHVMGPVTGKPVLYSHMGYCMARWTRPMIKLAFKHGLRVICPIRAGYGQSSNLDLRADVRTTTREDTIFLLDHLGLKRLPYVTQGVDMIFAADLAAHRPDLVSEIIGLCARPSVPGDRHYAGMGKWHRFFLSTARHAPHLLNFTTKAAISMGLRIGFPQMLKHMNSRSPADLALLNDPDFVPVFMANSSLVASKGTTASQAYTMELLDSETDWSDLMQAARKTPTWFVNGIEDPALDTATIAEYREHFPWIEIEVMQNAGQLLIYQAYQYLIPRIAEAARNAARTSAPGA